MACCLNPHSHGSLDTCKYSGLHIYLLVLTVRHVLTLSCRPSPTPGAAPTALHSGGAIVDETGIMTDGAGVPTGTPLSDPPLVSAISEDPLLRNVKMIAEAWDCDGLYQVRRCERVAAELLVDQQSLQELRLRLAPSRRAIKRVTQVA